MSEPIKGISRTSLWRSWKAIRGELKKASIRDAVDHLEYDVNPDAWIRELVRSVAAGTYEPSVPLRFTEAKSNGFSRMMTMPSIPDLVLYRTVVDYLYVRARKAEAKHAYCERADLPKTAEIDESTGKPKDPVWQSVVPAPYPYETSSQKAFRAWLRYHQYRKYLILEKVHPYIVITDITNFFDSVLYDRVRDSFHDIRAPPRMINLLFYLLERLSIRDRFSESPRIGLPVDEFACSRKLAHIMLFPHDFRMTALVGQDTYVRWMDDQNIGVSSRSDGLKLLSKIGESLRRLHLVPNGKKSKILKLSDARRHFHFDLNGQLDELETLPVLEEAQRKLLRKRLRIAWHAAKRHDGVGEWGKVLKRYYRLAGSCGSRMFRRRAIADVLREPTLVDRIAAYMRCSGTTQEYLDFVSVLAGHPEQVYPDVVHKLTEHLLRIEATGNERQIIRRLASAMLQGKSPFSNVTNHSSVAPLLMLRFGDRRSLPLLRSCFDSRASKFPSTTVRAAATVYASYGRAEASVVARIAGRNLRGDLVSLTRMLNAIKSYEDVPERWRQRCDFHYDPVARQKFLDQRGILAIRLLGLCQHVKVRQWLSNKKQQIAKNASSSFEKDMVKRLWP